MTPEEAMPDSIDNAILINQEAIDKGEKPPLWFTAKETAEISKSHGHAIYIRHSAMVRAMSTGRLKAVNRYDKLAEKASQRIAQYKKLFEEWSK